MPVIFSTSCEYALQAVLYLAKQPNDRPVLVRNISKRLDIPQHFLNKILQTLVRDSIVVSYKGLNGGFELGQSPKDIRLIDIVRAIDGDRFLDSCILGFPGCGDKNPCPVHDQWKRAKNVIVNMLHKKTLAELSRELNPKLRLIAELAD